jgi:hypothetical protein
LRGLRSKIEGRFAPHREADMAMADGGPDDLPRTFRRERDAQREQRERESRERAAAEQAFAPTPEPAFGPEPGFDAYAAHAYAVPGEPGVVTALKIPFFRLVFFFIKAVFAAIPALILMGIMLWAAGEVLRAYRPDLIQWQLVVTPFPTPKVR